jgi:hypothetical protein
MQAIRLKAMIDDSHRLQLDLPADTPTGEAEVIVLLPQPAAAPPATTLRQFFDTIDRSGRPRLSAEEVDLWIETERKAWD